MASATIIDINAKQRVLRGSIGTLSALSTSITWFDMGNPGAIFPFMNRLGGSSLFSVSFEGTFNMTFQFVCSLQDTTPASTPAGVGGLAWPQLGSFTGTSMQIVNVTQSVRWIGLNCSAFTSGSGTGWVYATLPS